MISTVDRDARHTRKCKSRRRDGFRGHVAAGPETGLVTDCGMTMATGQGSTDAENSVKMAARDRFHPAADPGCPVGKLLLVPEGQRRSELDLLRHPPFTPTITGLVRALGRPGPHPRYRGRRTGPVRGVPPARIVALARHPGQAWATQLAELVPSGGSPP